MHAVVEGFSYCISRQAPYAHTTGTAKSMAYAVEHASVAGENRAGVLDSGSPLYEGLDQVA